MPQFGAVEIVGLGPVSVATTLWRSLGILRATAVVKATFNLVPGGAMTVADAAPLSGTEAHYAGNPMRSIRASSELSPFLKKADVLLIGHAHPRNGVPSPRSTVRLAVLRNDWALIDKTLTVLGDRTAANPEPTPFLKMPIVYERAFGGIGSAENPLGAGVGTAKDRALPNFVHAVEERADPAGFGPISWSWPARRRRLRGFARKQLSEPIAEIPDDFDLEFFQASPPDQRTTYLRGDEVLVLEGLNLSHPRLETVLPGVRGAARVYTPDGIEINLTLHADTLSIDGDAEQCSITWRGSFPVASEEAIGGLRILAGVESAGRPIAWPTPARLEAVRPPPPPPSSPVNAVAQPSSWEGTYTISVAEGAEPGTLAAPFAIATPGAAQPSARPPIPGAPWARQESKARPALEGDFSGTRAITDEKTTQVISVVSLLSAVPAAVGVTIVSEPESSPEDPWAMTHAASNVEQKTPHAASAPFAIAEPGAARGASKAPIPGAPWTSINAQRPPPPKPRATMNTMATIDIVVGDDDDEDEDNVTTRAVMVSRLPPPPPAPAIEPAALEPLAEPSPPAAPVAPEPPVATTPPANSWSWVSVAPAASTIQADSAPRPTPPKPVLSKKLYGGFGSSNKKS